MPEMDGYEVCRRIRADQAIAHLPVIMVSALSDVSDRVRGLEAGADDFLSKPVNDVALFARVKSLVRVKTMMDELRLREQTGSALGVIASDDDEDGIDTGAAEVQLVANPGIATTSIRLMLEREHKVIEESDGEEALRHALEGDFDLIIVSQELSSSDGLRHCSQLRSAERTRQVPILILVQEEAPEFLIKGLELGVNDYLVDPIDSNELRARTRTQIRQKRYQDRLRASYRRSVAMAATDGLTGLYNRRYFDGHLLNLMEQAAKGDKPLSLFMVDIDFFKKINDAHGHSVGDEVLREFAARLVRNLRGIDLAARYGGEEFIVAMPDTVLDKAKSVADRLLEEINDSLFPGAADVHELPVTASIGVTTTDGASDTIRDVIDRADHALYEAKKSGRNRVVCATEPQLLAASAGAS
jgi:two-component system cell cycle response regulator